MGLRKPSVKATEFPDPMADNWGVEPLGGYAIEVMASSLNGGRSGT